MKRILIVFAVVALGALASCKAQKTCPTYSKAPAQTENNKPNA